MNNSARRYDLDWLRVIAILLVLFFHTAMIFSEGEGWHIKNESVSSLWTEFNFWLTKFRMPLLFFISGVGSLFALKSRKSWGYVKERSKRLMVPLVMAMFLVVPPQIYVERIFNGEDFASFLHFYPTVLDFQPYPEGNFSWHHMWFVLYLFVYSVVALPLFLFLKSDKGAKFLMQLSFMCRGKFIYLIMLPSVLVFTTITQQFDRTNDLIHDFGYLPYWMTFFVMGYFVACRNEFWDSLERNRKFSLKMAMLSIVVINFFRWNRILPWESGDPIFGSEIAITIFLGLLPVCGWFWLLAMVGYGKKYLNRSHPVLAYANEAIYPFYILHQTVIIVIGYYVIQVQESILAKYGLIAMLSFVISMAIYEFVIRPFKVTRFLFGMKQLSKTKAPTNQKRNFSNFEERGEFRVA